MPKVNIHLLNRASLITVGTMMYTNVRRTDRKKHKRVLELSGITKGQWKRMQYLWKRSMARDGLRVSDLTLKKLHVMAEHGQSPHLETLLKMVEVKEAPDEPVE